MSASSGPTPQSETATKAIDRRTTEVTPGAALLDEVHAMLAKFIVFPNPGNLDAVTLWAVHTHALDSFETTPRLALLSPEPGSGKTRVLEILELLVLRPQMTVNVSPAYLFRKVADEDGPPTLLYDEIDTVFGAKARENEDIRGMLNAGYRRGATAGRCKVVGKVVETEELPAFAAVALAGLNDRRLPDTLLSRCIVVKMRRRAPGEHVEPYRRRTHEREGHALRDKVVTWVASVRVRLAGVYPDLPAEITDRNADVWEPLIAIADAAGGSWPERARGSAVAAVAASQGDRGGAGVDLLRDTRTVFGVDDFVTTAELLDRLYDLEESQWTNYRGKPLDARVLSEMLGDYEIGPGQKKIKGINTRGYERYKFEDAWTRYLPPPSSEESDTSDTSATDPHVDDTPAPSPDRSGPHRRGSAYGAGWGSLVPRHRALRGPGRRVRRDARMTVTAADDLDHERVQTCVHEAGHATAYVVHGQPFKAVKVWEVDGLVYGVTKMYGGQVDPLPHLVRVYAALDFVNTAAEMKDHFAPFYESSWTEETDPNILYNLATRIEGHQVIHPDKTKQRAIDQLRKMGYAVTLNPLDAAG